MLKDEKLKMILMQAPNYLALYTNHMHQLEKKPDALQWALKKFNIFLLGS